MSLPARQIFLLCYRRPDTARLTIESVLAQNASNYQLIISDNSPDDSVASRVVEHFPHLELRRRGGLPAFEHFNLCIGEASAEGFCLFHDDDLMEPDFVRIMSGALQDHPEAVAIGCNAFIVNSATGSREIGWRSSNERLRLAGPRQLFRRYFGRHQSGIAPFPGYVYRSRAVGARRMPTESGTFADVAWLLTLAATGPILWCREPLMQYFLHGGNDGQQESLRDRLRFLAFLKAHADYCGPEGLQDYRYFLYRKCLAQWADRGAISQRLQHLTGALRTLRWRRLLRSSDWQAWWLKKRLRFQGVSP